MARRSPTHFVWEYGDDLLLVTYDAKDPRLAESWDTFEGTGLTPEQKRRQHFKEGEHDVEEVERTLEDIESGMDD